MNTLDRPTAGCQRDGVRSVNPVRHLIALSLIGRTVDLLSDARTIAHGVVTGVLTEAGVDKLVVGGVRYDLNQILTVTPTALN